MDVLVTQVPDRNEWHLTDLLGRDMGTITERKSGMLFIEPAGRAVETLAAIKAQPYLSVDAALAAIELHTRSVCRRVQ